MLFSNPRYDTFIGQSPKSSSGQGSTRGRRRQSGNRWLIVLIFRIWLPFALVITLFCGLVYLVVQQDMRMDGNDPQISLAEEISHDIAMAPSASAQQSLLSMLQGPLTLNLNGQKTDIAESLEPYVIVYDQSGNPIASTGELDGAIPTLPAGVFSYAQKNGEDRLTWQPRSGVRQAIVVTSFNSVISSATAAGDNTSAVGTASASNYVKSGFVVAGRSLREVESREGQLTFNVLISWIVFLLISLIVIVLF